MARLSADWRALRRAVSGDVLLPGSDAYWWVRKPFIARFDEIEPQAIVRCAAPGDVAEAIAFARQHGIETATRSGGHCTLRGAHRRAAS
jgi:FAD/FMN-containing dehydrogenase